MAVASAGGEKWRWPSWRNGKLIAAGGWRQHQMAAGGESIGDIAAYLAAA